MKDFDAVGFGDLFTNGWDIGGMFQYDTWPLTEKQWFQMLDSVYRQAAVFLEYVQHFIAYERH